MALIDVSIIDGDPDTGPTRAGCVQTDLVRYAHEIQPRASESRFVVVFDDGSRLHCVGDVQAVLTP